MGRKAANWQGDWAAILRASYGEPVPLDPWERREAIYWMTRSGMSGNQIAERLRVSRRTVCRHRAACRTEAAMFERPLLELV